mmetsp:Transcript_255/g.470  ORF Transcript_255/g.470 Transcript_255/m.470 type:complete len:121 (-) Transcript_255:158-520(-)
MMQQMMSNPQAMQNMMQARMNLLQQMNGGAGMGGYGAAAQPPVAPTTPAAATTPAAGTPVAPAGQDNPMAAQMQRARFATQLSQLSGMGFGNEAACLRALAQHNGRVDAAIDTLLSEGSS